MAAAARSESDSQRLVVVREFDAPRALVFRAWTDPKQVAHWWGPNHFTNPRCDWDARAGGAIRVDMKGPDGVVYPMSGTFREVVEPERLVFVSAAHASPNGPPLFEVLNTVTFADAAGGRRTTVRLEAVVERVTPAAAPYLAGMNEGWAQTLDRLASHVATTASDDEIITTRVFDAPPDVVFDAWTDSNVLGQWWGPRGFTTTTHSMDFKPGGHWRYTMHGPDGTDYPNRVTYTEIARPHRIVYRHGATPEPDANDFQVTAMFEPAGDAGLRTRITIRMAFPSAEAKRLVVERYGAIQGQRETFDRLDEFLATPCDKPAATKGN